MSQKEQNENDNVKKNNTVTNPRIAMIDVDRVVAKSSSVKKLKSEHDKKNKELERWLKNVKKQIEKPDSQDVQEKLIKRYDKEFAQKKEEIAKDFQSKLKAVNDDVTSQINAIAKENNYDIVLSKAVVVLGCDDITELIEQKIK
mgnify:CR=1 FL=1